MKKLKFALASILLAMSTSPMAGPITVDAGWYGFCFGSGTGQPAVNGCQNYGVGESGNPFTFSLAGPGLLKVTDAFLTGDSFAVFINSVLAFTTTSTTGPAVVEFTPSPDDAFDDGGFSSGSFLLGAGNFSVEIFTVATLLGGGGAYLEVESVTNNVPEPRSFALFGLALTGLALSRRRKNKG